MKHTIMTLGAGLGGGYSDKLHVYLDTEDNLIHLVVTGSVPRGGMDGDPTPFYSPQHGSSVPATCTPQVLLGAIKRIIADDRHLFKDYGRPTKMSTWTVGQDGRYPEQAYGLSLKLAKDALKFARDQQL